MHAVRIKGGEGCVGGVIRTQVETCLAPLMTDHQLTTGKIGRQYHHQGREHARGLLGIAVLNEKTTLVIHQQLVQLRMYWTLHAQSAGGAGNDGREGVAPVPPTNLYLFGRDLPGSADIGIHQSLLAATIGRWLSNPDELLGLDRQQRQCNDADAIHLQARGVDLQATGGVEVAGALESVQDFGEGFVDGGHSDWIVAESQTVSNHRDRRNDNVIINLLSWFYKHLEG